MTFPFSFKGVIKIVMTSNAQKHVTGTRFRIALGGWEAEFMLLNSLSLRIYGNMSGNKEPQSSSSCDIETCSRMNMNFSCVTYFEI